MSGTLKSNPENLMLSCHCKWTARPLAFPKSLVVSLNVKVIGNYQSTVDFLKICNLNQMHTLTWIPYKYSCSAFL